uniref:3-mercaptopyruvate sulfurtransferase n=1 Tax=Pararhizobium sp. IMCC3301 TaxID=3067904 RepID=UPI0027423C2E|nr:3-mercaptopyruvate sulfurtransferase [Pararhizobium sp. IMCC3301]
MRKSKNLVSAKWLRDHLADADLKIIDGSWYLPQQNRDAIAEYTAGHIPGAVFFDVDANSDQTSDLPHMMPAAEVFAEAAASLGISNPDTVVIYDGAGLMSAARIWWMFRAFGHEKVFVLDGGLPAWKSVAGPLQKGAVEALIANYRATLDDSMIADWQEVMRVAEHQDHQVLDARSAERFKGLAPEPRAGVKSGRMPGAKNLPFQKLLTEDGIFKSDTELQRAFEEAGIDLTQPVITTCGSGVTAAILSLGLSELGHSNNKLYDGSWAEWGWRPETAGKIIS